MAHEDPVTQGTKKTTQLCTFRVGNILVGIEVNRVQEINRDQTMTSVPLAAPEIKGLINLRGQIVTAIDLRYRLGLPERSADETVMNAVVHSGSEIVSLLVDEAGDVVEVQEDDFEPVPPNVSPLIRRFASGTYKLENELLLMLDADEVIDGDFTEQASTNGYATRGLT